MADANHDDFYRRIDRIYKIGRHGTAPAATGFFSRVRPVHRTHRQRVPVLRVMAIVLLMFVGLKGVIHAQVGPATYQKRVETLQAGTLPERLSAYVLKADAMTLLLSHQIRQMFPRF